MLWKGNKTLHYNNILKIIKQEYQTILGDNLVGIYVHGSIAFGCFHEEKSDIDFIAVIQSKIDSPTKLKILNCLKEIWPFCPPKGIEMSIVLKKYCLNFEYPTPYELHFSKDWLKTYLLSPMVMCGDELKKDKDLAAHFTVIRNCGIVLWGEPIQEVFGEVPRDFYIDSIKGDILNADEEILKNTTYITLNLCRVLAYLQDNKILSKEQGGKWALKNIDDKYHLLIKEALNDYRAMGQVNVKDDIKVSFSKFMMNEIMKLSEKHKI